MLEKSVVQESTMADIRSNEATQPTLDPLWLLEGSEKQKAALRLLAASKLINQAVGDALSGLLLAGVIVVDRSAVVTANAETMVVKPNGVFKSRSHKC